MRENFKERKKKFTVSYPKSLCCQKIQFGALRFLIHSCGTTSILHIAEYVCKAIESLQNDVWSF